MLAVSFLQWWYLRGWLVYFDGWRDRIRNTADFFSIGLLLRTLFQPFRQISANETGEHGGPAAALRAFGDRLLSRIIGCIMRILIIVAGLISLIVILAGGSVLALIWPIVPLMPVVGLVLYSMGVLC